MAGTGAWTTRLPGGLRATVLPIAGGVSPQLLRVVTSGELYLILGSIATVQAACADVLGGYVGMSRLYSTTDWRPGVSYQQWVTSLRAIAPAAVVLIGQASRGPLGEEFRRYLESLIIWRMSERYFMLNSRRAAPAAAEAMRAGEIDLADRVALAVVELTRTHVFDGAVSPVLLRSRRERLLDLVRTAGRGVDTDDVLVLAAADGMVIGGSTPWQSARRDLAGRLVSAKLPTGVKVMTIGNKTVFHSEALSSSDAASSYRAALAVRAPSARAATRSQKAGAAVARPLAFPAPSPV